MTIFFLYGLIIFCFLILIFLGLLALKENRKKKKTKKALIKLNTTLSEYKYVYRNIKED